ncbi:PaaX family transcriptional regulator [Herbihabitans rhizosphaerae]|uniref:PaaX family transcriptional regulator n=1 Tax=Herbihabitans rhizosphaerae TaxID=1872711 RepID=A0A4Q7L3V0_9PSEU|nr:PaaX family transcriptional regulator C-terminal domain-containing protein [Herbihabitans rhizosphaerae]RZS44298.1 PaaX family transcriptional regulator [Herbihabitans rhizosphaerae]
MRARSALFDVYGGYLRSRGGSAAIAALVRLLEPLGFGAPAIRTAVSRMVRQGWLAPIRLDDGPGYTLTPRGQRRLDEAGARIYRTRPSTWDGRWHVVVLEDLPVRHARDRLASSLRLLGYGPLGPATWVAPRPSPEIAEVLAGEEVLARVFHGELDGGVDGGDTALATRAWDLDTLGRDYRAFVSEWDERMSEVDGDSPAEAFAASQRLLHAWRKFLFRDPGLPDELLPADWPGHRAARFFDEHTARLAPAAKEFLDDCLNRGGRTRSSA